MEERKENYQMSKEEVNKKHGQETNVPASEWNKEQRFPSFSIKQLATDNDKLQYSEKHKDAKTAFLRFDSRRF